MVGLVETKSIRELSNSCKNSASLPFPYKHIDYRSSILNNPQSFGLKNVQSVCLTYHFTKRDFFKVDGAEEAWHILLNLWFNLFF